MSASVEASNYGFCPNTVVWSGNQALFGDDYATEAVQIQVVIGGKDATRNTEPIVPPPQVHLLDRIGQLVIDAVDLVQVRLVEDGAALLHPDRQEVSFPAR